MLTMEDVLERSCRHPNRPELDTLLETVPQSLHFKFDNMLRIVLRVKNNVNAFYNAPKIRAIGLSTFSSGLLIDSTSISIFRTLNVSELIGTTLL